MVIAKEKRMEYGEGWIIVKEKQMNNKPYNMAPDIQLILKATTTFKQARRMTLNRAT